MKTKTDHRPPTKNERWDGMWLGPPKKGFFGKGGERPKKKKGGY